MSTNMKDCFSLLEYDGEMFIGVFPSTQSIIYQTDCKDGTTAWVVLNCADCSDIFASYLLGKATLRQAYDRASRTFKKEDSAGNLTDHDANDIVEEVPSSASLLYHPAIDVFKKIFPNRSLKGVQSYCHREKIIQASIKKHFPTPTEKNDCDENTFKIYSVTEKFESKKFFNPHPMDSTIIFSVVISFETIVKKLSHHKHSTSEEMYTGKFSSYPLEIIDIHESQDSLKTSNYLTPSMYEPFRECYHGNN